MKKLLEGKVVSVKMNNTVIVEVVRKQPHPVYKKILTRSKKYKADSKKVTPALFDIVKIIQTRPLSKDKHFEVVEIISKQEK